jgi:hypothetical protein
VHSSQDPRARASTPPPSSYMSALRELESPVNQDVLNLAATLTTQAEAEPDPAGLRNPRRDREDHGDGRDGRDERPRDRLRLLERGQRDDADHRERLRRVMNRLSRIHDPHAAYGDRVPSQNNLYDWSPANEADDEDELDQILAELRREQPNTHPEILRVLGRSQLDHEREARRIHSLRLQQPSHADGGSLRSAAILQSVRRHPRFSARTRDYLQRSGSDRETAARLPIESRDRHNLSGMMRPEGEQRQPPMPRRSDFRPSSERERAAADGGRARDRDISSRLDSFRRTYLDHSSSAPPVSPLVEQSIKYLSRIRQSSTVGESLACAVDTGFLNEDIFCDAHAFSDFVLDTFSIPPPAETSWLAPGAVLSGCQHATTVTSTVTPASPGSNTTLDRFRNTTSSFQAMNARYDTAQSWTSTAYPSPRRRLPSSTPSPATITTHAPQQDSWPVKVTIHAVDYDNMTLAATMEAYNVPSHPHTHSLSPPSQSQNQTQHQPFTRTSSITTYLEGEILDFNTHTLLTESFKSSACNDATYWRKLPCFRDYRDEELVRNLTSRKWLREVLTREWVLMRWKEKCFVRGLNKDRGAVQALDSDHDQPAGGYEDGDGDAGARDGHGGSATFDDSGCGLTISGFYYVCLRRSDGRVDGLYFDPQSSPYQCLELRSVNGGVRPAWGFR